MNVLSHEKQVAVIAALTEGSSIRSTERMTGVHRDTVMRLGRERDEWTISDLVGLAG
jgi:transposase-like protein